MGADNLAIGGIDGDFGLPLGVVRVDIVRVDGPSDPVRLRGGGICAVFPRDGGDLTVGAARAASLVALLEGRDGVLVAVVGSGHGQCLVRGVGAGHDGTAGDVDAAVRVLPLQAGAVTSDLVDDDVDRGVNLAAVRLVVVQGRLDEHVVGFAGLVSDQGQVGIRVDCHSVDVVDRAGDDSPSSLVAEITTLVVFMNRVRGGTAD